MSKINAYTPDSRKIKQKYIDTVLGKLQSQGLSYSSKWSEIEKCLDETGLPTFCKRVALRARQNLMIEDVVIVNDGYNGDTVECYADPIDEDQTCYKLQVKNSHLTKWISKEEYNQL